MRPNISTQLEFRTVQTEAKAAGVRVMFLETVEQWEG